MRLLLSLLLLLSVIASSHSFALHGTLPLRTSAFSKAVDGPNSPRHAMRASFMMSSAQRRSAVANRDTATPVDVVGGAGQLWTSIVSSMKAAVTAGFAILLLLAPLSALASTSESGGRLGGGSFYNRVEPTPAPVEESRPSIMYRESERSYGTERYTTPSGPVSVKEEPASALAFVVFGGIVVYSAMKGGPSSSSSGSAQLSVVKLQVALYCPERGPSSVLGKINSLASSTNTGTQAGIESMVSDISLALLRSKGDWISAALTSSSHSDVAKAERAFSEASLEERAKIDRETVNKRDGKDKSDPRKAEGSLNAIGKPTAAVITLVLGLDGCTLPEVEDAASLKKALTEITAIVDTPQALLSAELLWTPEEAWETVMPEDVPLSYPKLIPL